MALLTSSLAKICNEIRNHVDKLGQDTKPADWNVSVTVGAPGVNLAATNSSNTLNLFFYRFEPSGFNASARPGDVQWMRVFCVITAFGVDEDTDNDSVIDASSGFNELSMLAQVMKLFQEQPVMLFPGDDTGEIWHTQFIPRPLADEQINQIWSTQGDTVYRPSVVYEIALAPIEPEILTRQAARVASIGAHANGNIRNRHSPWPADRETRFPPAPSVTVDTSNPQWAPAIVMLTGLAGNRQASLTLSVTVTVTNGGTPSFSGFPEIEIWIAGDIRATNAISIVGQLLQRPADNWKDIAAIPNRTANVTTLAMDKLPDPAPAIFTLSESDWTNIDATNNSWQLQLFAERYIRFNTATGTWEWEGVTAANADIRIRSNPVLITLTREAG